MPDLNALGGMPPGGMPPGMAGGMPGGATQPMPGGMAQGGNPPGASPMANAGDGAGKQAAAMQAIRKTLDVLRIALGAFPPGSKQYSSIVKAIGGLAEHFAGEGGNVPTSIMQNAQQRGGIPGVPPMMAGGAGMPATDGGGTGGLPMPGGE